MNTIVISRLIGSEAGTIAKRLADVLGYSLVDKIILQETLQQYGITRFGKLYTSTPNLWDLANSKNVQVISMLNDTINALAHRGRTVIIARGAYATLNNRSNVLKVRIQAPFSKRVDRLMVKENSNNRERIEEQVASDDKARMKFVKLFYNQKCCDATDFDLVINTDVVPIETAEEWIIKAARMLDAKKQNTQNLPDNQSNVDPLLLDAIDQALERRI